MPKTVKRRKNKLAGRYRNRWPDEAEISGRMIPKWVADSCRNRWPDHPEICSVDIGYETADMYSFVPNAYGIYLTAHNGQPMLENGAGKFLIGNIDKTNKTKNSDTNFARAQTDLLTYTLSGYKFFDLRSKLVGNISYSEMDSGETAEKIAERGYTTGGLGYSATVGYQIVPEGFKGFSPILIASYDQYGETLAPQLEYWFKPGLRTWVSHAFNTSGQDITRLEFQWDF